MGKYLDGDEQGYSFYNDLIETSEGDFLLATNNEFITSENLHRDYHIVMLDSVGNVKWTKVFS
ncbi:MAG: hypothetical protein R2759_09865 [Bacteroidales bacterium]